MSIINRPKKTENIFRTRKIRTLIYMILFNEFAFLNSLFILSTMFILVDTCIFSPVFY
jgi:hypothetical protein